MLAAAPLRRADQCRQARSRGGPSAVIERTGEARCSDRSDPMAKDDVPSVKSDEEWRRDLTPAQYHVLREHGTERAGSSPLNDEKRSGNFYCAGCGAPLFDSKTKYESGSGWPSF